MADANIFSDQLDGQFDASRYLSENAYGFLPVPVIITDPAVEGGLGMMGLFFHESDEEKEARLAAMRDENNENAIKSLMPPSVSAMMAAYTGNDSYFVGAMHMGFFKQGRIRYAGGVGYGDVSLDFYGFGDQNLPRPIEVNTKATMLIQSLKFKVGNSKFYLGPLQRFTDATIAIGNFDVQMGKAPTDFDVGLRGLLSSDVVTSGAGLTLDYDSRDNFYSPTSGFKYSFNHLWFSKAIGSDRKYTLTELSGLNYFKINDKWRSALKVEVNYANAQEQLPTYATPGISLRGIPAARYQGKSVAVSELEVAYRLNLRWELSAFAGIGKASDSFSDFSDSPSRVSRGVGFRYLMVRQYGFQMGIDIAKGPEDTVFYIQAGSAW